MGRLQLGFEKERMTAMITVKDVLKKGMTTTVVISPADTVYRALQLMAENNVGAVMISDKGRMVGIFTERDYCRKVILMGRSSLNTPIEEIMTKKMITVNSAQQLEECLELMTKYHIRHLPVQDNEKLAGVVSMRDVMEMLLSIKDDRIERLESYILGNDYNH
jgi:CBS domain-containing protein